MVNNLTAIEVCTTLACGEFENGTPCKRGQPWRLLQSDSSSGTRLRPFLPFHDQFGGLAIKHAEAQAKHLRAIDIASAVPTLA